MSRRSPTVRRPFDPRSLPPHARRYLLDPARRRSRRVVADLHEWLRRDDTRVEQLTAKDVEALLERLDCDHLQPKTVRAQCVILLGYLDWLHAEGLLGFDPHLLRPLPVLSRPIPATPLSTSSVAAARPRPSWSTAIGRRPLPPFAIRYLDGPARYPSRRVVADLHGWLHHEGIGVKQLTQERVEQHLATLSHERQLKPSTLYERRGVLLRYLDWLHVEGLLPLDPAVLRHKRAIVLPELAEEFVQTLWPTHKPGTYYGYMSSLCRFYRWLDGAGLHVATLTRADLGTWHRSLLDQGLHAATRRHLLIDVRSYLRWLHDEGHIDADPDLLIRRGEMPKLPVYLPRPLPPETDLELQRRLAASPKPEHQALLLMRWTGLRVGELASLDANCVRTDPAGHRMLKVPLGKLDTERLVPLHDEAHRLVGSLLAQGRRANRRWLLETPKHAKVDPYQLRHDLRAISAGLDGGGAPITTHRLRHTYATTLLSAGMSLVGLMKLLGHRDYRMTLRYAAITEETVRVEYFTALSRIEARYTLPNPPAEGRRDQVDPHKLASDLARWLTSHAAQHPKTKGLVARIQRLAASLARVTRELPKA